MDLAGTLGIQISSQIDQKHCEGGHILSCWFAGGLEDLSRLKVSGTAWHPSMEQPYGSWP